MLAQAQLDKQLFTETSDKTESRAIGAIRGHWDTGSYHKTQAALSEGFSQMLQTSAEI